jgi:hypothetical protein
VAKLVARLLATAALLVRIQAFLKNTKQKVNQAFFAVGKCCRHEFSFLPRQITKAPIGNLPLKYKLSR